jgi:hypothetical protein
MLQIPITDTLTVGGPNGSAIYHVRLAFVDPTTGVELSDDQWRFAEGTLAQEAAKHCVAFEQAFAEEYAANLSVGTAAAGQITNLALLKSPPNHYLIVVTGPATDTSLAAFLQSAAGRFTTQLSLVGSYEPIGAWVAAQPGAAATR